VFQRDFNLTANRKGSVKLFPRTAFSAEGTAAMSAGTVAVRAGKSAVNTDFSDTLTILIL
jgi:hypothetical protein